MSSLSLRPIARRHHRLLQFQSSLRRYATESSTQAAAQTTKSTAESAAAKAQETAANALSKAQELYNKGLAAAGPMAAKLGESTMNAVNKAPGGGNKLVARIQGLIPPTVYYSKVVAEMAKQVWHQQKMSPPSLEAFQKFYAPYYTPLLTPQTYLQTLKSLPSKIPAIPEPQAALDSIKAVQRKDWAQYGVWAAEFLGFFTVGQMIGRRKIVGYRGGEKHDNSGL